MEDEAPVIYGLEFQARSMCAQEAETESIRFLVGTQSLRAENQVHFIDFDDENSIIRKTVFRHRDGEIWNMSACTFDSSLFSTCFNKTSDTKSELRAAVWQLPSLDTEPSSPGADDSSSAHPHLTLTCYLETESEEGGARGDVRSVLWHPAGDSQSLIGICEDKIVTWDLNTASSTVKLLDIVKEESEKKGLELNRKKTEVMVVSRKQELPIINIYIKGTRLKQKDQFKYLGSLISSDGRNNSEVASRIAQAKTNFQKMKTVLTNKNISIRTRRRALECYIEPILMYGCEAWTISKQTQRKLEATEMWFLRRMLRISWTAKKTNDKVLEEAHTTRLLISKIRKRQATFFGHVMRREKLENLVTTGMLEGKRSRGKQREKLIEGLTDWLKAGKSLEAIEATKDRKKWRTMIANAVKQGT
ncbi:protein tssc1-like [Plakobranchus ocellatus]|uniref:Protein tssc1-like n=1 Tax=Plakobranchus ocellatus TaxID=259542 RepID=A0AAV3YG13_9GAST|nr:protein tssc1-like [Plakobranchus ocellatus]